jgi:putative peptide maturation system protein
MPPRADRFFAEATALLRRLPRGRQEVAGAREEVSRFRERHPGHRVDLLVDQAPGSPWVEYDLLVDDGADGTVALSWRGDGGVPWSVRYTEHWAANLVVTVNDSHLSVQDALLFLKFWGEEQPALLDELVEQQLLSLAIDRDPPDVTEEELQLEADSFRHRHGLESAQATTRWLAEVGLSEERFSFFLEGTIQRRKLVERVTGERCELWFEQHRRDYDSLRLVRAEMAAEDEAARLAAAARGGGKGLLRAMEESGSDRAVLESRLAHEVPAEVAGAEPGSVVGPVNTGSGYQLWEVLGRRPAVLDPPTRAVIQTRLFRDWLTERRAEARVRWHWM